MNKKKVDLMIIQAYEALSNSELVNEGKTDKAYRSHVAAFGAAMATGSLLAAVSNFVLDSQNANAKQKQGKVMGKIMWDMLKSNYRCEDNCEVMDTYDNLLAYITQLHKNDDLQMLRIVKGWLKEIAVAMKLAMNFLELMDSKKESEKV